MYNDLMGPLEQVGWTIVAGGLMWVLLFLLSQ